MEEAGTGVSIGFEAGNVVELLKRAVEEFGSAIRGPITPVPSVCFYFVTDPDGYQVQLFAGE